MVSLEDGLDQGLAELGLDLECGQKAQLMAYIALLEKWNRAYNLTAIRERKKMLSHHILDSLTVLPYISGRHVIDVGSGAGFPGMVLAIADPARHYTLLDSNGKKTRFLQQVVAELGLENVAVVHARIESYRAVGPFDCVLARAVASLAELVSLCTGLIGNHGRYIFMKGRYPEAEIAALPETVRLERTMEIRVPGVEGARHIVELCQNSPMIEGAD